MGIKSKPTAFLSIEYAYWVWFFVGASLYPLAAILRPYINYEVAAILATAVVWVASWICVSLAKISAGVRRIVLLAWPSIGIAMGWAMIASQEPTKTLSTSELSTNSIASNIWALAVLGFPFYTPFAIAFIGRPRRR